MTALLDGNAARERARKIDLSGNVTVARAYDAIAAALKQAQREAVEACIDQFLIRHAVTEAQAEFANAILTGIRALLLKEPPTC